MLNTRRRLAFVLVTAAFTVVFGAWAWACTSNARLDPVQPAEGPARSIVTVTGAGFYPQVDIRWASDSGPLLARTTASFTVDVTIPDVAPGTYYIVAVSRGSQGDVWQRASTFTVTAPAAVVPPPAPPADTTANTTTAGRPADDSASTSAPAVVPNPQPAAASEQQTRISPAMTDSPDPVDSSRPTAPSPPAALAAIDLPAGDAAPASAALASPEASPTSIENSPTSTDVASAAPAAEGAGDPMASAPEDPPSPRTASSDLWSGFVSGGDATGNGLVGDGSIRSHASSSGGLVAPMALLTAALVVLAAAAVGGLARAKRRIAT